MTAPDDTRVRETSGSEPARTETVHSDRVVERRTWVPALGPGLLLGALGAVGVVVSCFTAWSDPGAHPADIPVAFLGDSSTTSTDPSLLIALIPIALVIAIGTFVPMGAAARLLVGLAMLVVTGLFAFQLDDALPAGGDLGDALGTGFYAGAIGGLLALASGFVPSGWTTRREVRSDVT